MPQGPHSSSAPPLARALGLEPHPEGGWFRETWRSEQRVTLADGRLRSTATAILFLLPEGTSSRWHLVTSEELWIHGEGPALVLELGGSAEAPSGGERRVLGTGSRHGERRHVLVPAGVWQRTLPAAGDTLVSCIVSPGFDFADFRMP